MRDFFSSSSFMIVVLSFHVRCVRGEENGTGERESERRSAREQRDGDGVRRNERIAVRRAGASMDRTTPPASSVGRGRTERASWSL
jgi:hypothetical protein